MRKISLLLVIFAFSAIFTFGQNITEGSLFASGKSGQLGMCPLKHTSVKADISGFLARVTVTQEFENSFTEPIEAVYTFPLSQNSAVDAMTMKIGARTIRGKIMKREDARKVYEQAKTVHHGNACKRRARSLKLPKFRNPKALLLSSCRALFKPSANPLLALSSK